MTMYEVLSSVGLQIVQTIGIIASILFGVFTVRREIRTRRVAVFIELSKSYRDVWSKPFAYPELLQALDANADPAKVTPAQRLFILHLIRHMEASFEAERYDLTVRVERGEDDIRNFFSLPIPREVWRDMRGYTNLPFRNFVDGALGASTL